MQNRPTKKSEGKDEELLEQLNRHPDLKERVAMIMRLADGQDGTPRTADELEGQLIEEVRQLGQQTMTEWAKTQAERVEKQVEGQHRFIHRSKKNG